MCHKYRKLGPNVVLNFNIFFRKGLVEPELNSAARRHSTVTLRFFKPQLHDMLSLKQHSCRVQKMSTFLFQDSMPVSFFFSLIYFQDLNNRLRDTVLWFTCILQGNTHWLRQILNPSQDNNNNNVILIPRWNHFLKRQFLAPQRFYSRRRAMGSYLKYTAAIKIRHTAQS